MADSLSPVPPAALLERSILAALESDSERRRLRLSDLRAIVRGGAGELFAGAARDDAFEAVFTMGCSSLCDSGVLKRERRSEGRRGGSNEGEEGEENEDDDDDDDCVVVWRAENVSYSPSTVTEGGGEATTKKTREGEYLDRDDDATVTSSIRRSDAKKTKRERGEKENDDDDDDEEEEEDPEGDDAPSLSSRRSDDSASDPDFFAGMVKSSSSSSSSSGTTASTNEESSSTPNERSPSRGDDGLATMVTPLESVPTMTSVPPTTSENVASKVQQPRKKKKSSDEPKKRKSDKVRNVSQSTVSASDTVRLAPALLVTREAGDDDDDEEEGVAVSPSAALATEASTSNTTDVTNTTDPNNAADASATAAKKTKKKRKSSSSSSSDAEDKEQKRSRKEPKKETFVAKKSQAETVEQVRRLQERLAQAGGRAALDFLLTSLDLPPAPSVLPEGPAVFSAREPGDPALERCKRILQQRESNSVANPLLAEALPKGYELAFRVAPLDFFTLASEFEPWTDLDIAQSMARAGSPRAGEFSASPRFPPASATPMAWPGTASPPSVSSSHTVSTTEVPIPQWSIQPLKFGNANAPSSLNLSEEERTASERALAAMDSATMQKRHDGELESSKARFEAQEMVRRQRRRETKDIQHNTARILGGFLNHPTKSGSGSSTLGSASNE